MKQIIKLNPKYPGLDIQAGEITRTYQGKSRRGVITYWLYKQEIIINGVKHVITGADESWLNIRRNDLYNEQYKLFRKNYKHKPRDPNVEYVIEGSDEPFIGRVILTLMFFAGLVWIVSFI
jgi:hypothetical protein